MNKKWLCLSLIAVLSGCISTPMEAVHTDLDPSIWTIGFQKDFGTGKGYIREWVKKGDNINSWSQLFSIEFLENEKKTIHQYSDDFVENRKKQCDGTTVEIIKETEFSRTYILVFPPCAGHDAQSEITRMFQGNDGLHRVSYAEKGKKLSLDTINKWNRELKAAYIIKGPNQTPIR